MGVSEVGYARENVRRYQKGNQRHLFLQFFST